MAVLVLPPQALFWFLGFIGFLLRVSEEAVDDRFDQLLRPYRDWVKRGEK